MKFTFIIISFCVFLANGCAKFNAPVESSTNSANGALEEPTQDEPTTSDPTPSEPEKFSIKKESDLYRQRYGLKDPSQKLVNNHGDLYEDLYGTRNFRVVLHGVYYRGGANNLYNKNGTRDNMNPLPAEGLTNLCKEGFKNAIYLYPTNFATAPKAANCKDYKNEPRKLDYSQMSGLTASNSEKFIAMIYKRIKGDIDGPIYGHCWNGWHSSGFVGSITLKQFCGYTDQQAVDYWIKNTDGNNSGYDTIKANIKAWKPITKYKISAAESAAICP